MSINLTQQLLFETDDIKSLRKMARVAFEIVFKEEACTKYTKLYLSHHAPISYADSYKDVYDTDKKDALHVCSIRNYRPDFNKHKIDGVPDDVSIITFDEAIEEVASRLENYSKEKFNDLCGEGFNFSFLPSDGDIRAGYRMSLEHTVFPGIAFGICHILYGK